MSSKKRHRKKSFTKRPTSRPVAPSTLVASEPTVLTATAPAAAIAGEDMVRLSRIKRDVRRALMLAVIFIGLQLILWYVFGHTGLGNSVYNLVKL